VAGRIAGPAAGPRPGGGVAGACLAYQGSVAYGGPWLLDQLWQRLGIGATLAARLETTRRHASAERVLFALPAIVRAPPRRPRQVPAP
jgi:hypothetical protein